jgi:hypothetical protein
VWGLTELLVDPMPHWGIFEYTRQCAEAIRGRPRDRRSPNISPAASNGTASKRRPGETDDLTSPPAQCKISVRGMQQHCRSNVSLQPPQCLVFFEKSIGPRSNEAWRRKPARHRSQSAKPPAIAGNGACYCGSVSTCASWRIAVVVG